ncbi:MAG: hypothetical protein L6R36_008906 [Xanthoria steineri]|nr:MAG: hypothetical protein L6R36_008906 [Xanthoria steineri]
MAEPPSGPPPASASSEQSRLKGHIGHLTRQEEAAVTDFKKLSADQGLYRPETNTQRASHDDGTLVRYLRARKFVPQDALAQFKDTEKWRKDNNLDALYEKIDIQDYQEARSVYPQWTGRRDRRGIPVYLYEVGKLDSKKMIAYSQATSKSKVKGPSPSRMLRLFALYENLTRFVMPLCSAVPGRPNPESPVDQSNNIVDISRVGLKQFWNLRNHMQDASQLATAHYPETLDRIFIIGAPSFFPTVWGWIKKWFDPITTSKIFILSQEQVKPTLSAFMDVSSIPKKYGGDLDFECGMMPSIDPDIRKCLEIKDAKLEELFLTGPTRWVDSEEGEMVALSVGSIDGKPHKEAVATMSSLAVRTATGSSMFQSQRSHPNFSATQLVSQPASQPTSAPQSRPQSKGMAMPQTQMQAPPPNAVQQGAQQPSQAPQMQPPPPNAVQPGFQPASEAPQRQPQQMPAPVGSSQQQIPPPSGPTQSASQPPTQSATQPALQSAVAPESESILPNGSVMKSQPAPFDGTTEMQNGEAAPPKSISMPPPQLSRMETQYMTPATEPSELKHFQ